MEQCVVCGAALRQGDEWCGQCYAPRNTSHPSYRGPGAIGTSEFADPRVRPPTQPHEVRFSRFRGGPTSMGVVGRVFTSILALLLACAIYLYIFPVIVGEASTKDPPAVSRPGRARAPRGPAEGLAAPPDQLTAGHSYSHSRPESG